MTHPFTDIVVLLPGIMGSTLTQHGRPVWGASPGAAIEAVRTFGHSIKNLTLPAGIGDGAPGPKDEGGGVVPTGLFPDIHVVPGLWTANVGYGKLESWLVDTFDLIRVSPDGPPGNFVPFAYDWRLSIRYNGRRLANELGDVIDRWRAQGGPYADAKVVFIAHSMGGLVARWAIDQEQLATETRRLITLATPHRGSMMAVDRLVNGIHIGWGPLTLINLTDFGRSLPGLHHLLPAYACLQDGKELKTVAELALPVLDAARVADAMTLHRELDAAGRSDRYHFYPLVGSKQQTATTGTIDGREVVLDHLIGGNDEQGDGTVPRLAATPQWLSPEDAIIHYATDKHGGVQSNQHVIDTLEAILTSTTVVHRGPELTGMTHLDLRVPEVCAVGADIEVRAVLSEGPPRAAKVLLLRDDSVVVARLPLAPADDGFHAVFAGQPEGLYTVRLEPATPGGLVPVVNAPMAVWGPASG